MEVEEKKEIDQVLPSAGLYVICRIRFDQSCKHINSVQFGVLSRHLEASEGLHG